MRQFIIGIIAATLALTGVALPAVATQPDDHQVPVCHALPASASHAFNLITVDIASSGYVKGGHHEPGGSIGPKHSRGGDIIPPYTYRGFVYPGQNWTARGQAIYENGCKPVVTYDMTATITICGDPKADITLVNGSNVPRSFRVRYVRAKDGTVANFRKTVPANTTKHLTRRWVAGHTMVWVKGERGERLASVFVNRKNNSGPCPVVFRVA